MAVHIELISLLRCDDLFESLLTETLRRCNVRMAASGDVPFGLSNSHHRNQQQNAKKGNEDSSSSHTPDSSP